MHGEILQRLLGSAEPSVRYLARTSVLGEAPTSPGLVALREEICRSSRVTTLLSCVVADEALYAKWRGAHWVLASVADLCHPGVGGAVRGLRDAVVSAWLEPQFFVDGNARGRVGGRTGVPVLHGRHRRCASQQGSALLSSCRLGIVDDRTDALAERLLHWQWPDGGWNCDKNPAATHSSFMETLLPMRALHAYGTATGNDAALRASRAAAEVFLTRRLAYRASTGDVIDAGFMVLHHPLYWHYDVLGGLVAMGELGLLGDERCSRALDHLESLAIDNGWPAARRFYQNADPGRAHYDWVDWGPTGSRRPNEWVTTRALGVLRAARRLTTDPVQ